MSNIDLSAREERQADQAAYNDKCLRERLDIRSISQREDYDLKTMQLEIIGNTDFQKSVLVEIAIELTERQQARKNGPVFSPKDYVEMTSDIPYWTTAMSTRPFAGLKGRVSEVLDGENEGLVVVNFPPKPLGYGGSRHLSYIIPNYFLKLSEK